MGLERIRHRDIRTLALYRLHEDASHQSPHHRTTLSESQVTVSLIPQASQKRTRLTQGQRLRVAIGRELSHLLQIVRDLFVLAVQGLQLAFVFRLGDVLTGGLPQKKLPSLLVPFASTEDTNGLHRE